MANKNPLKPYKVAWYIPKQVLVVKTYHDMTSADRPAMNREIIEQLDQAPEPVYLLLRSNQYITLWQYFFENFLASLKRLNPWRTPSFTEHRNIKLIIVYTDALVKEIVHSLRELDELNWELADKKAFQ